MEVCAARVWPQLPPELAERIASHLHPAEIACTLRLVNKAAAVQFRSQQPTTIHLSQPVPPHAFARQWLSPSATRGMTLEQRRQLVALTAASGVIPNVQMAMQATGCLLRRRVLAAAGRAGNLEMCQWLLQHGCLLTKQQEGMGHCIGAVMYEAAGAGHTHVCKWLLSFGVPWKPNAVEAAARGGHVDLMEWLLQHAPAPAAVVSAAGLAAAVAEGCDLTTLQRLWPDWVGLRRRDKAAVLAAAAGSPTPDWAAKAEWLEGQGCPRTRQAAAKAAACPDALVRLAWLQARGYRLKASAVEAAARNGNTEVVLHLLSEGVQKDYVNRPVERAIRAGHLSTLQALHAAGWLPYDTFDAFLDAARGGYLHILQWLDEALGVAVHRLYSRRIFLAAASAGSVEMMAWLRQRGCGLTKIALTCAAKGGCEEALEWLVAQGCPIPEDGRPYLTACKNGDLATARCLRRLGVPWGDPDALVSAVVRGGARPPMLRWLLETRCPADLFAAEAEAEAALERAEPHAAADAAEMVELLRQHRLKQ